MLLYFIFLMLSPLTAQQLFPDYDLLPSFPYQQQFPQSPHFQSFPISQEEFLPPYENIFQSNGATSQPFPGSPSPSLMSLFTRPSEVEMPRASNEFSTFPVNSPSTTRPEYGSGSGSSRTYRLSTPEYSRRSSRRDSTNSRAPYVNRRIEERIVDKILDNLPALAASFMGSSVTAQRSKNNFASSEMDRRDDRIDRAEFRQKPSSIVDIAPEPSSIFSFGKLMSSLGRQSTSREINPKFLGGIPLSKSEDGESNTLAKTTTTNPEDKSLLSQILRSVLHPIDSKNYTAERRRDASSVWTHSDGAETPVEIPTTDKPFLERLVPNDLGGMLKSFGNESKAVDMNSVDPLKSLLSGRLDEMNWLNMILGSSTGSSGHDEEGNALMQLIGKPSKGNINSPGGLSQFFGSGLDDDPSIPNRKGTRNF